MSIPKQRWYAVFYWLGVALVLACFAFVIGRDTRLLWRFEHRGFPLSWAFAGAAILAFLLYEVCHRAQKRVAARPVRRAEHRAEWEADSFQKRVV